jgi:hypothetical protein
MTVVGAIARARELGPGKVNATLAGDSAVGYLDGDLHRSRWLRHYAIAPALPDHVRRVARSNVRVPRRCR